MHSFCHKFATVRCVPLQSLFNIICCSVSLPPKETYHLMSKKRSFVNVSGDVSSPCSVDTLRLADRMCFYCVCLRGELEWITQNDDFRNVDFFFSFPVHLSRESMLNCRVLEFQLTQPVSISKYDPQCDPNLVRKASCASHLDGVQTSASTFSLFHPFVFRLVDDDKRFGVSQQFLTDMFCRPMINST